MLSAPVETRPWWRRPRVRLSLRALMIVVLIVGGWLGWIVRGARIQREAVAAVERGGGSVRYDWEWATFRYRPGGRLVQPMPKRGTKPPWSEWLVARLGPDFFGDVKAVVVGPTDPDAVMAHVARLGRLESFAVTRESPITDEVNLGESGVTDAGLVHLDGLKGLDQVILEGSRVTEAGIAALGAAHPGIRIVQPPRIGGSR